MGALCPTLSQTVLVIAYDPSSMVPRGVKLGNFTSHHVLVGTPVTRDESGLDVTLKFPEM